MGPGHRQMEIVHLMKVIKNLLVTSQPQARPSSNPATHIAIAIVLVVATMTTTAFLAKADKVPWTTLIFLAGTVGGVVNNFRRIQKLPQVRLKQSSVMAERLVTIQIYVSPFVGGVFAIVLYGIFMSGLVQGALFPAFKSADESFATFDRFAALSMPNKNTDMAKALVWAFIAGFSEGLVPNFISKITKDAKEETAAERGAPEDASATQT